MNSSSNNPSPAITAEAYTVTWSIRMRPADRTRPLYRFIGKHAPHSSIIELPGVCKGDTKIKPSKFNPADKLTLTYDLETENGRYQIVSHRFSAGASDFNVIEETASRVAFTTSRSTQGKWGLSFTLRERQVPPDFVIDPEITHSDETFFWLHLLWVKVCRFFKRLFGLES